MRVLQIVTRRQFRGAEVFASLLTSDLIDRGHQVSFVGLYQPPVDPLVAKGASNLDLLGKGNNKLLLVFRLWQLIRKTRPDVVQCNGSDTLKYTCAACLFLWLRPPIVYRNISLISHWINSTPKLIFYRLLFSFVKVVVSVSDASREDFVRLIKKSSSDVITIKNVITIKRGIEIPRVANRQISRLQLETKYESLGGGKILLHVGSMSEEKNHEGLLRIVKRVVEHIPNAFLLCVGDGALRRDIESYAVKLGIADHVIFEGYQPDPSAYFVASDLLLLTSHIEGIPGVVLEAASFQTPSIGYSVGGMNEAIEHGVTGILIEHDDESAFALSVINLLQNSEMLIQMGRAAREFVELHYNREVTVKKFEELYRELAKGQKVN